MGYYRLPTTRAAAASIVGGAAPPRMPRHQADQIFCRRVVSWSFSFFSPLPTAPPLSAVSCGGLPCPIDRVCRQ